MTWVSNVTGGDQDIGKFTDLEAANLISNTARHGRDNGQATQGAHLGFIKAITHGHGGLKLQLFLGNHGGISIETDPRESALLIARGNALEALRIGAAKPPEAGARYVDVTWAEARKNTPLLRFFSHSVGIKRAVVDKERQSQLIVHHGDGHQHNLIDLGVGRYVNVALAQVAKDLPLGIFARHYTTVAFVGLPLLGIGNTLLEGQTSVAVHECSTRPDQPTLRIACLSQLERARVLDDGCLVGGKTGPQQHALTANIGSRPRDIEHRSHTATKRLVQLRVACKHVCRGPNARIGKIDHVVQTKSSGDMTVHLHQTGSDPLIAHIQQGVARRR